METMIFALIGVAVSIAVGVKILPPLFYLSKFSYSNAKFSAIPITFLKEKEIVRLLEAKSLEELKNNIVSRDFILKGENAREIQHSIDESLFKIIKMARNDSPKNVALFYTAYMKKIDSYAVKEAILALKEEREIENKAMLEENREMIERIKANKENAQNIMAGYGWEINLEKSIEEIERDVEKRAIEFLHDEKIPKSYKKSIDRFVKSLVDILNLKTILRGKYYNLPIYLYGEGWELPAWKLEELMKVEHVNEIVSMVEDTSYFNGLKNAVADFEKYGVIAFEKALDCQILKIAREIANDDPLGIGPGIRFIVEKEFEARNLKIVVKAVEEKMQDMAKKLVVVE
ncbi:MAG: hypothetical protein FE044_01130 [Thermoplasmata archaeon]|nr:MAG: hypothetical protein FE044_01130 [Thermoplasmata archaeon]